MSIRQSVFRLGETIEISGFFTNEAGSAADDIVGARLIIKQPPSPNSTSGTDGPSTTYEVIPVDGIIELDIKPTAIGTYKVRLECDLPSPTVREARFEVVDSMVVPVLPYSFY